jgi:hypothetical protein
MKTCKEISLQEKISNEKARLNSFFTPEQGNAVKVVEGLIERAAFMRITLDLYEKDINENGSIESFTQSEKTAPYDRERPVVRLYAQMAKNYQAVMRQIAELVLPAEGEEDDFDRFIHSRDG